MNKLFLIFLVLISTSSYCEISDNRVLVKLPFKDREEILSGMRKYLKLSEKMLLAVSSKNYEEVERLISKIEIDRERLDRLSKRGNINFIELAYKFHSEEVRNVKIAARLKNQDKMIMALSKFLNSCNTCHEQYRLIEWPNIDYPAATSNKKFIEKYINQVGK